ncbi:adenosylcobinamide-GDP ribazoletransferase, partial [Turicibacter sanguinis]|nr:adenosylcobinamide-GDP ribazoletransferase [Turicibacter sanguinis]
LLSRRSQEEKIRILKDSRVGAFAVISLVLLLICQFSALQTLLTHQQSFLFFILIPIISRSLVGYFLITKETISESYLGKLFKQGTGRLDLLILSLIYFITFLGSYLLVGILGIAVPLFMGIAALLLVRNTQKQLGGFNGDVAGYILVLCEFIGLLTLGVIR